MAAFGISSGLIFRPAWKTRRCLPWRCFFDGGHAEGGAEAAEHGGQSGVSAAHDNDGGNQQGKTRTSRSRGQAGKARDSHPKAANIYHKQNWRTCRTCRTWSEHETCNLRAFLRALQERQGRIHEAALPRPLSRGWRATRYLALLSEACLASTFGPRKCAKAPIMQLSCSLLQLAGEHQTQISIGSRAGLLHRNLRSRSSAFIA